MLFSITILGLKESFANYREMEDIFYICKIHIVNFVDDWTIFTWIQTISTLLTIIFLYRYRSFVYVFWRAVKWASIKTTIDRYERAFFKRFMTLSKDGKFIQIRYYCKGWHVIDIPTRKVGAVLTEVINQDGNSVTRDLKGKLGPFNNFQGQYHTPLSLGYESLTFRFLGHPDKTYDLDEPIVLW